MTTNQTIEKINVELHKAQNKDMNINIESTINTSVHFLDVTITNENGQLRTSIFHKPTTEPYILPYTSDHPLHVRSNIPYAALLRAARICSHVNGFNTECIRIDMSLLLNHYPPNYIKKQFHRFFHLNNALSVLNELNEEVYHRLHEQSLYEPTRCEKQLDSIIQDPVRNPMVLQPKIWNSDVMYPQYLFDTGLTAHLPKQIYTWWKTYAFPGSPVENVQVRIVSNMNGTLDSFLIHKKPPPRDIDKDGSTLNNKSFQYVFSTIHTKQKNKNASNNYSFSWTLFS